MNPSRVERRIRACWLGKSIGGTLGAPFEGRTGPLDLDFYRPVPSEPLPNDDLDLQVVWLHFLLEQGKREVTPDLMAAAWLRHVRFPFDEYGVVPRNNAYGLRGPQRGAFDNFFGECMGGAIRSELWACVAPGDPARAAGLAWADAVVDHSGEGVYAEMFHAALQAAAFVDTDRERLIETGLQFVPPASRLGRAVRDTRAWWNESRDWLVVRDRVLSKYAVGNFTDVVCNLCFELIGWYAGEGDFGRSICIAVNCGLDTDCTGATLGALLGILDPDSIPEQWVKPIGEGIVLSREIIDVPVPVDINELTRMTMRLAEQLRDFPAPIGVVHPTGPQTQANPHVSISAETAEALGSPDESSIAVAKWHPTTLHGHWSRWAPSDPTGKVSTLLRCSFTSDSALPSKLMVAAPGGATVWVDGQRVMTYSEEDYRRDVMTAPSLHRAGVANHLLAGPGEHELVVALAPVQSSRSADLVIAVGDAATSLWQPWGFVPRPHSLSSC